LRIKKAPKKGAKMHTRRFSWIKIMALAVIFASGVFTASASGSSVFVSGDVSGVWSADSVILVDSVQVPAGETLVIEPGVDVLFSSYFKFYILDGATLQASGTPADTIRFLGFLEGDRGLGLDFINASSSSILEYCYFYDSYTSAVHLDNSDITIRNCWMENCEAPTGVEGGGAIEILNGSSALIENNTLRHNISISHGGAIFISASNPVIMGNNIIDNAAAAGNASGGAMHIENNSSPQIINNMIIDNSATALGSFSLRHARGGAVFISGGSDIVISGNFFSDNRANWEPQTTANGGALYIINSDPYISHNVFVENEAEHDNGGAIYMENSDAVMVNNTIAYNQAGRYGGALYSEFSNPAITNSILFFNTDSLENQIYGENSGFVVTYSDVQGSWPGNGNKNVNPLFRDPMMGDYHLQDSLDCGDSGYSLLIDSGSPGYSDSLVDCSWGLGDDLSDMGAYGGGEIVVAIDDNQQRSPSGYFLIDNYPNPFNAFTTIHYNIPEASNVSIEIYDELGRLVTTLIQVEQSAGNHDVSWNASDVASGLYFYKIQAGDIIETNKMILLK
jgi:predicted outer membrane repeat protein